MTMPDDTRLHANFCPGGYVEVFETDAVDEMPVAQTSDGSTVETIEQAETFLSGNMFRRTGEWNWDSDHETTTATVEFLGWDE